MITCACIVHLPFERFDLRLLFLVLCTTWVGSRLTVKIPRINGEITVADSLIFLIMLLYGGEAAILLAAVEAVCSSLRVSRKPQESCSSMGRLLPTSAVN